jgi:hypothetical protein
VPDSKHLRSHNLTSLGYGAFENKNLLNTSQILLLMRKEVSILKGLVSGDVTIHYIGKRLIKKTPGELTRECRHQ